MGELLAAVMGCKNALVAGGAILESVSWAKVAVWIFGSDSGTVSSAKSEDAVSGLDAGGAL